MTKEERAALMDRVAMLLKQYPGVADQPEAAVRRQAWRIVHYGTGARLAGRYEESSRQLEKLGKRVRPLREFLESKANLNPHAVYALEDSGLAKLLGARCGRPLAGSRSRLLIRGRGFL